MGNKGSQPEEAVEDYSQPHASRNDYGQSGATHDGRRQGVARGGGHGGSGKHRSARGYEEPVPDDMGLPPPPPPEDSRVERPWKKEQAREGAPPTPTTDLLHRPAANMPGPVASQATTAMEGVMKLGTRVAAAGEELVTSGVAAKVDTAPAGRRASSRKR